MDVVEILRTGLLKTGAVVALLAIGGIPVASADSPSERPAPPNVVLILLDDVGFGDTSTFGGPANTPSLTRLAESGLRYNAFHTTGVCSPTRAALLSGRNHHRVGWGSLLRSEDPGYDQVWKKNVASIPEILKRNGYSTAAFGKWHNTPIDEITPVGPFERWPTGLGFEYYFGNMLGMSNQWHANLWRGTLPVVTSSTRNPAPHLTDELVDDAIRWIQTHQSLHQEKPYFLYFAPGAVHVPHHVAPEWIQKYRGRFSQGWDALREQTFKRQKKLGVIPDAAVLTPRPKELPAWSSFSVEEQRLFSRQMEVYAGFLEHTDAAIGRLLDTVAKGPGGDNTLIVYIVGDNGGEARLVEGTEDMSVYANRADQRDVRERLAYLDELGGPNHINVYAAGWAWAGSAPFQWTKPVASHFGATRNPVVLSWPGRIRDRGGSRRQFTHVTDIAPTIYEVAGIRFPASVDGVEQLSLDGVSMVPSFDDPEVSLGHTTQYFEIMGNRAIYHDGWIAAARHEVPWSWRRNPADFDQDPWELYDIGADFSQSRDLAAQYPDKLAQMKQLFDAEARRNDVYPFVALDLSMRAGDKSKSRKSESTHYYHDGFWGTPAQLAPPFSCRSFEIIANVTVTNQDSADGVIVAYGGWDSGFSLFLKDGRVVFEANYKGRDRQVLLGRKRVPLGTSIIRFEYTRGTPTCGGTGSLYVANELQGTVKLSRGIGASYDNFDIGQDSASPVTDRYPPPFRMTTRLDGVWIHTISDSSSPKMRE